MQPRRSGRTTRIDYAALNNTHVIQQHNVHPHIPTFKSFAETHPTNSQTNGQHIVVIDKQYTDQHGKFTDDDLRKIISKTQLKVPVLIRGANKNVHDTYNEAINVDFNIPYYGIRDCARLVGHDVKVPVMDIMTQNNAPNWDMRRWCEYFDSEKHDKIMNVISLEITETKLGEEIEIPKVVEELDMIGKLFADVEFGQVLVDHGINRPNVLKYILMSVENCYTDFHIDFAGTSVYYSLLSGHKQFILLPPTDVNLRKYKEWCLSESQNKTWFPSIIKELTTSELRKSTVDECYRTNGFVIDVKPGDLLLLPSMWIHAVYTAHDSIIIGGNYLNLLSLENHLKSYKIEIDTRVNDQFKFPHFLTFVWLLAYYFTLKRDVIVDPLEMRSLTQIRRFLTDQLACLEIVKTKRDRLLATKIRAGIPKDIIGDARVFIKELDKLLDDEIVEPPLKKVKLETIK